MGMHRYIVFIVWVTLFISNAALAQCPQPSFTIPDTVCINESFTITNTSTGADRYEWDFSSGDLQAEPSVTDLATVSASNIPTNITTIFDGTNWFGFFFSRENNLLFRLDFGSSLDNTPTVVNVGTLGTAINKPEPLEIVKEGGNWYGFTANSLGNSNLIRLNFGSQLINKPTLTNLTNFGGKLNTPRGLKLVLDNGNYIAVVTNAGDTTLAAINFGNSITNIPTASQVIKSPPFPGTNNGLLNTSIIKDCQKWYGITVSFANNRIYKLDFDNSLLNIPVITDLTPSLPAITSPFSTVLVNDDKFYCFIGNSAGNLVRLNFEGQMSNMPTFTNLGNFGIMRNIRGLTLEKIQSEWTGLAISNTDKKIFRIKFPENGNINPATSTLETPANISYTSKGLKSVTLTTFNSSNEAVSITKPLYVRAVSANFTAEGTPPVFKAITLPDENNVSWSWDFGDGTTGMGSTVQHDYSHSGTFDVKLTVQNVCGLTSSITKKIGIVNNAVLGCPQVLFSIPDTICVNEPLNIVNNSIGVSSYEWDFCSGDLNLQPSLQTIATITSAATPTDITTVFDGINWYGFVSSRDNNKIFRLNFGNSLNNTPSITDIGNPGGLLSGPRQMKIIKEDSNWIGLVLNATNNGLVRLNFGSSLTSIPVVARVTAFNTHLQEPMGIAIENDNGNNIVLIANSKSNVLTIGNFNGSINNTLTQDNIINVTFPGPFLDFNIRSISVVKECNEWYGLAASFNNKIYKLSFGKNLFSVPVINEITTTQSLNLYPVKVNLIKEQGNFYGIITHRDGRVIALDFGKSLVNDNPAIANSFIYAGSTIIAMEVSKFESNYNLFTIDFTTKNLVKFAFPLNCSANQPISSLEIPTGISYTEGGVKKIELIAYDHNKNMSFYVDSVFVRPEIAADFSVDMQCEGAATQFFSPTASSGNRIKSWAWDFGDGSTSTEENPTHTFATSGEKNVRLIVTDACNQSKIIFKSVKIYENSIPDFIAPATVCSFEPIIFQDATQVVDDTIISWLWNFGNGDMASSQNPTYTYTQAGNYTITLTIKGKSGCSMSVSKSVSVTTGAEVKFLVENPCFGKQTSFTDLTTFADGTNFVSREWHFGDGSTSDLQNPVHQYATLGSYVVKLVVQNDLGCITSHSKTITISLLPEPAFSFSLACSGDVTSFFDESTSSGGAISAWEWDFGDTASGSNNTSNEQNPSHIFTHPGSYTVKLKIFTASGCTDSLIQTVNVIESPQANFSYQIDCSTKQVTFTDQSLFQDSNSITAWFWEFGDGSTSQEKNPQHIYTTKGIFDVKLIVTAASRCTQTYTQPIQIYNHPRADFENVEKSCINNSVQFTDKSSALDDQIQNWLWEFGDGSTSQEKNPQHIYTTEGIFTIILTITTASGCSNTHSRTIQINSSPDVDFEILGKLCTNSPLQFVHKINSSNDPVESWLWEFGTFSQSTEPDPYITFTDNTNLEFPVKLTITSTTGCVVTISKTISLKDIVKVDFSYEPLTEQAPLQINFTNTSSQDAVNFEWDFGDGNKSTEKNPTHNYKAAGVYTIKLSATNESGCMLITAREITISNVSSGLKLKIESLSGITQSNQMKLQVRLLNNSTATLTQINFNTIADGNNNYIHTWEGSLLPDQSLNYAYEISDHNLPASVCVIAEDKINHTVSNKQCINFANQFIVLEPYPNPGSGNLTLGMLLPAEGSVTIMITDVLGKSVNSFKTEVLKKGLNEIAVATYSLSRGVYLVKYDFQGSIYTKKLIIQ